MSYNLQKGWNMYASGEYDIFLNGTQKTFFLLGSITHRQTKGYGLRSEILLDDLPHVRAPCLGNMISFRYQKCNFFFFRASLTHII